jgi:hypothetical protein
LGRLKAARDRHEEGRKERAVIKEAQRISKADRVGTKDVEMEVPIEERKRVTL